MGVISHPTAQRYPFGSCRNACGYHSACATRSLLEGLRWNLRDSPPEARPALPARPRCGCKRLNLCQESLTLLANASAIPDVPCLRLGTFRARESAAVLLHTSPPGHGRGPPRASCTAQTRERRFHHGAARFRNEIAWTPELTRFGRRASTTLNTSFVCRARCKRRTNGLRHARSVQRHVGKKDYAESTAIRRDPVVVSVMRAVPRDRASAAPRAALDRMPPLRP